MKIEMATFFNAFPNGTIWGNRVNGQGYDMVMMGGDATAVDPQVIAGRTQRPEYGAASASLREVGFNSASELFGTYAQTQPASHRG